MSHNSSKISRQSLMFPVEWPLTSETVPLHLSKHNKGRKIAKSRREKSRAELGIKRQRVGAVESAVTNEESTQTELVNKTTVHETNDRVTCQSPEPNANVFECLNEEEATWLADEINQANKNVFKAEQVTKKLRKDVDLEKKKESLSVLKNLVEDLRWNIKYPDEETAKDLETLDDASNNFGVRNMVNYLSLLDGYFVQLQNNMDK